MGPTFFEGVFEYFIHVLPSKASEGFNKINAGITTFMKLQIANAISERL